MSVSVTIDVILIIAWVCLVFFKRTRPLTLVVAGLWVGSVGLQAYIEHRDNVQVIGAAVIIVGLLWNMVSNRKTYISTVLGKKSL